MRQARLSAGAIARGNQRPRPHAVEAFDPNLLEISVLGKLGQSVSVICKRLLRKANERTVEATWRRIGNLLDHFPPAECANYIRGAGYASI